MIYDKLSKYSESGVYPMHMPGHKRNTELLPAGLPYDIDITEIHDFDNLHDPHGVIKDVADLAAKLYGSDRAFPLVNGATAGILSAIGAHAERGDKILVARNSHLSVYNAIALFGLEPVYIVSEADEATGISCSINPESVKAALEKNEDAKLVVVTSPTYEGVISDIGSIAAIAHERGIPLIVDEAHGAHLGFFEGFPRSAVQAGADIVVMSLHKTLPALTQCALLHVCGELAGADEIARLLAVFQTSSPSYVLLASIDRCLRMLESEKDKLFGEYKSNLDRFGTEAEALKNLSVLCKGGDLAHPGFFAFDPGKIVIATGKTSLSGLMLSDLLREEHKIELEMAYADYAVAMTSVCDTSDGFERLSRALMEIDSGSSGDGAGEPLGRLPYIPDTREPSIMHPPSDALKRSGSFVPVAGATGLTALEYVWAYPPGIPIVIPGEVIDAGIISHINQLVRAGNAPRSTYGRLPFVYVEKSKIDVFAADFE